MMDNRQEIQHLRGILMKLGLVVIIFALVLGGCAYLNEKFNLPNDHVVEEAVEAVIEAQLGIDLDLTPQSP